MAQKFQFQDVSVRSIAKVLANAENLERSMMQATFNAIHHVAKHGDTTPLAWLVAKSPKTYRNRLKAVVESLSGITFGTNAKHATGMSVKGGKRGMTLSDAFHEFADEFAASPFGISHPRVDNGPIKAMKAAKAKVLAEKKAAADAITAAKILESMESPTLDAEKQERQHTPGTTAKKAAPAPAPAVSADAESFQLQVIGRLASGAFDTAIVEIFHELELAQQADVLGKLQAIYREEVEERAAQQAEAA